MGSGQRLWIACTLRLPLRQLLPPSTHLPPSLRYLHHPRLQYLSLLRPQLLLRLSRTGRVPLLPLVIVENVLIVLTSVLVYVTVTVQRLFLVRRLLKPFPLTVTLSTSILALKIHVTYSPVMTFIPNITQFMTLLPPRLLKPTQFPPKVP